MQNVSAGRGGRSYLPWEKVGARSSDFLAWLNGRLAGMDSMAALDIYVLSFEAHFRLVTIHPWSDGNGRVARLVMNLVQMEGEVAPTIVRSDHKVRYIESLRASQEAGTPEPFLDFMTDELIDALAHDIDEYEHDLSRDVPWETFDPSTEPRSTPQVRRAV